MLAFKDDLPRLVLPNKQINDAVTTTSYHIWKAFDAYFLPGLHNGLDSLTPHFCFLSYVSLSFTLQIGHVIQSCLLIIFQHQPISLQYSWLSFEQPIRFRLSVEHTSLGFSNAIKIRQQNWINNTTTALHRLSMVLR